MSTGSLNPKARFSDGFVTPSNSKPLKFREYIEGTSQPFYDPQSIAKKQSEDISSIKNLIDKTSYQIDKNSERNLDTISAYLKLFDYHTLVVDCIKNYNLEDWTKSKKVYCFFHNFFYQRLFFIIMNFKNDESVIVMF